METLSRSVRHAVQACAESDNFSNESFKLLLEKSLAGLLNSRKCDKKFLEDSLQDVDPVILKQSYPALMTLFLEAAKADMNAEQLDMVLDDCKFLQVKKDMFLECYKQNKQKLRASLSLITKCPPHVVDVDWKLDYNIRNSQLNKVMEVQYTIALKTESNSLEKDDSEVQFSCTREQLQDFVGKLKEAVKAVERSSQN